MSIELEVTTKKLNLTMAKLVEACNARDDALVRMNLA